MWNPNAKNCYQKWTLQYWVLMHKALSVWEDDPTNNKRTCGLPTHRTAFNIACLMAVMWYVRCVTWLSGELEYTGIVEDSLWCLLVYWCLFGARSFTTIIMALPGWCALLTMGIIIVKIRARQQWKTDGLSTCRHLPSIVSNVCGII